MAKQDDSAVPSDELDDIDTSDVDGNESAEIEEGPHAEWFVIHSYSGMENKVKKNIEHRTESMGMTDRILEVVVPTETAVSYTHLRAHETVLDLVCRLLLEKKKEQKKKKK